MNKYIFDNSNLAESYSGVTTPLTYSFARHVYREVYKHFCGMMGVSDKVIQQNEEMFGRMLEFIGYRMYYNLINWYKLVSFMPGYKYNKKFFEKMLGVQKELVYSQDKSFNFFQKYFIDLPRLWFQIIKISFTFMFMGHLIERFNRKFDGILENIESIEIAKLSTEDLEDLYSQLMKKFLFPWRIPIANDFAVMVSTGIADKIFKNWLNEDGFYTYLYSKSHNSLITLDPGLQITKIVASIKNDPKMFDLFTSDVEPASIFQTLQNDLSNHQVGCFILDYLKKFGDRSPNELKLETRTLGENPEIFIRLLRNLVGGKSRVNENHNWDRNIKPKNYNKLSFLKKILVKTFIGWARSSIVRREETRFRRALIFGYARKIFSAIGQKLHDGGLLDHFEDIFFLTSEEVFDYIKDHGMKARMRLIIHERKSGVEGWKLIGLPRRIETSKSVKKVEEEYKIKAKDIKEKIRPDVLRGMVAARSDAEKISGCALVLSEFDPDIGFDGKILVTKQTDPGWTIIFPLLKGLIVERGGMLSHAAIVARELRIPCIVGVEDAVTHIQDGCQIQMNLKKGEIYA